MDTKSFIISVILILPLLSVIFILSSIQNVLLPGDFMFYTYVVVGIVLGL